ncbi:hypothetical protein AMTRI_Chr06g194900 [Amborella trichopoda]
MEARANMADAHRGGGVEQVDQLLEEARRARRERRSFCFVCDSVKIHDGECLVRIFNPWAIVARARQEMVTSDSGLDILLDFGSPVEDSLPEEAQRYNARKMSATKVLSPPPFMGLEMGSGFGSPQNTLQRGGLNMQHLNMSWDNRNSTQHQHLRS